MNKFILLFSLFTMLAYCYQLTAVLGALLILKTNTSNIIKGIDSRG